MAPKPRGRPPKKRRNISNLRNGSSSTVTSFSQGNQAVTEEDDALIARSQESDRLPVRNKKDEASSEAEDSETDMEAVEDYAESEWDELDDRDFAERLAEMAIMDDPNDLDWVPARLRVKKGKTIKTYADSMLPNYVLNAHRYALSRTPIAAWLVY